MRPRVEELESRLAPAANVTASMVDVFLPVNDGDGLADPGESIRYTVTIANTGDADATGVQFNLAEDANAPLVGGSVKVGPLAPRYSFNAVGNTPRTIAAGAGLKSAAFDIDGVTPVASLLVTTGTFGTTAGGSVLINADGSFTYTPQTGDKNLTDTFTYTLTDGDSLAGTGTVSINLGNVVWYVDSNAPAGGDGSFTNPFDALADVTGATGPDAAGDIIYVRERAGDYAGGITLLDNQQLLGSDVDLTVNTITVFADFNTPTTLTNSAGAGITLANGNTVKGFAISGTFAEGLTGSGVAGGTIDVVSISTPGTNGVSLTNATGTFTFGTAATPMSITGGAGGAAFNVSGGTASLTYNGGISQGGNAALVNIGGGHNTGTITFQNGTLSATNGTGLQFDNADGAYNFSGTTTLNGGDAGIDIVNGSSGTFSFGAGTTITSPSGVALRLDSSTANVTYSGNITKANAGQMISVSGHSGGTVTFQTGTLSASAGAGIAYSNADGTYNFNGTTTLNGGGTAATNIDILAGSDGTFTFNGNTSISNTITTGFFVSGSNANITYSGTISGNSGPAVDIDNHDGGTVTFQTGNISGSPIAQAGIRVQNSNGGAINFNNPSIQLSTGANPGVTLTNNAGATINFATGAGAGLDITTTSGTGFNATGGGTVIVTGSGNTINSTTGTALNIANTTIGASHVTFRSISAGGGGNNGINVDNTGSSGGLHVTGNATAASGGTIQNKTGADGSTTAGIGIYLNSTSNVQLDWMQLNDFQNFGIRGNNVTGFSMTNTNISGTNGTNPANDEAPVSFTQLLGSASITGGTFSGSVESTFRVVNSSGTLNRLTIDGTTFGAMSNVTGDDGIFIQSNGSAVVNVTVQNSFLTNARGDLIQTDVTAGSSNKLDLIFTGNTLSNNNTGIVSGGGGTTFSTTGVAGSDFTYNISNNTFRDALGAALAVSGGNPGSHSSGKIENNTIGVQAVANSGSQSGSDIAWVIAGGGTHIVKISNNTLYQYNNHAILIQLGDQMGNAQNGQVTVTGNTANTPGTINTDFNGIHLNHGVVGMDNFTSTIDIGGAGALKNTVVGKGTTSPNNNDIRLRQRQATTVVLPGYGGANNDNAAVQTYIAGRNTITTVAASNTVPTGGGYINGPPPTLPPLLAAPGGVEPADPANPDSSSESNDAGTNVTPPDSPGRETVLSPDSGIGNTGNPSPIPPQQAATSSPIVNDGVLTQAAIHFLVAVAIDRWVATGLTAEQVAFIQSVTFAVADMPVMYLGSAAPGHVTLDNDAAGFGWFIDPTPFDDGEFPNVFAPTRLWTDPWGAPAGKIDLLTTVLHELGHQLGLEDSYSLADRDSLLYGYLVTGERRLPSFGQADGAELGSIEHEEFLVGPVNIGLLPFGSTVQLRFDTQVIASPTGAQLSNQGTVTANGGISVLTDDPSVGGASDPNVTTIDAPPTVTGTFETNGTGNDNAAVNNLFAGIVVGDLNNDSLTVDIQLSAAANGTLSGGGFVAQGGGLYRLTGVLPAAATTALDAVVFTPTSNQVAPGLTVVTTFTVSATDGSSPGRPVTNNTTQVTITSINDPPTVTAGQSRTIDENLANGQNVGAPLAATDPDIGQSLQNWQIVGGTGQTAFAINAATGQVTVLDSAQLDREATASFTLQVTVGDGTDTSAAQTVTINLNDVNEFPPVVTAGQARSVDENTANGQNVGAPLAATDGDATAVLQNWQIVGGTGQTAFAINAATGQVTVLDSAQLDRETTASFTLQVTVSDGATTSAAQTVTINLNDVNEFTPVVTAGQSRTIDENLANGQNVGAPLSASDGDATAVLQNWQIVSGTGQTAFAINAATGQITVLDSAQLDRETTASFTLDVTVSDGANTSAAQTVTINLNDVNEFPPVVTAGQSRTIDENLANGQNVGAPLTATDGDATGVLQNWQIVGGTGQTAFAINAASGQVTVLDSAQLDRETTASFTLDVTVSDGAITSAAQTVTINLNDVNEFTPVVTAGQSRTIDENLANGQNVGAPLAATDGDATAVLQNWQIVGGTGQTAFAINAATGQVTVLDSAQLDRETTASFTLDVTVSDGVNTSAAQTVTINLNDVNEFTPVVTAGQSRTIDENLANGQNVGAPLAATDSDATAVLQNWQIVGGTGQTAFAINAATGQITVLDSAQLDRETTASFTLDVTVSDGANTSAAQTVTINLNDVNEFTPAVTAGQSRTIDENLANGQNVGAPLAATDGDATAVLQNWQIVGGTGQTAFAINAATGQITVLDSAQLDREATASFTLDVTVSDGSITSAPQTVTINLNDLNDVTPMVTAGQSRTIDENLANGQNVGAPLAATDGDVTPTVFQNWQIVGGTGQTAFALNAATGQVTVLDSAQLDREAAASFTLDVTVSDGVNTSAAQTVTINLNDLNDVTPVVSAGQSFIVAENSGNGTAVGTVAATDGDVTPTVFQSWTITGGNTGGAFAIDASTGAITVANSAALDFETTPVFTLQVTVSDGVNTSAPQDVVINLANAGPDLRLTKSDGGGTARPGNVIVWTLRYANLSSEAATGVTITETLPANTSFNAGASTPGWVNLGGGVFRFTVGNLAGGGSGTVLFAVTVVTVPPGVTQLVNQAVIADNGGNGADPNLANNTAIDAAAVQIGSIIVVGADAGNAPWVRVFDALTRRLKFRFLAYASSFRGGVRVAVGDVNGDGVADIITAPGPGTATRVKAFNGTTRALLANFLPYGAAFTRGAFVAAGNTHGGRAEEIIVGPDGGAKPVSVHDRAGRKLASFFPYGPGFSGGVRVAAGNFDGLGTDEIITAPGIGPATVKVFNNRGALKRSFQAFRGQVFGLFVAAGDVNGDGRDEIIVGRGGGVGPNVRVFRGGNAALLDQFFASEAGLLDSTRVGVVDDDGDGRVDLLAGTGPNSDGQVHLFGGLTRTELDRFFAFSARFRGGFFIAGSR